MGADVASFIARYENSSASEQQTKVSFINDLCDLLGVPRPEPGSGTPEKDRYVYEHRVRARDASGKEHTNWIDLYKEGHFVLEAKQGANEGAKKTNNRGTQNLGDSEDQGYEENFLDDKEDRAGSPESGMGGS